MMEEKDKDLRLTVGMVVLCVMLVILFIVVREVYKEYRYNNCPICRIKDEQVQE